MIKCLWNLTNESHIFGKEKNLMDFADKLIKNRELEKEEYVKLFEDYKNPETAEKLSREAVRIRKEYYGDKIYIRGLIEFTNYCKNNCYYCGIRRGNKNAARYRLSRNEIMECCGEGYRRRSSAESRGNIRTVPLLCP